MATKSVKAGDLTVSYAETGHGSPVILLHGGLATQAMSWGSVTPLLAGHFRVLAPDSRGHGETNNPTGVLSYDQMADDVVAFARAVGAERPLIFGFSDGGQIALEITLRYPGFARAYVLGGTVSEPSPAYIDGLKGWGFAGPGQVDLDQVQQAFGGFFDAIRVSHRGNGEPEYWRALLPQVATLWHGLPSYSLDQLGSVSEPTLIIMGDRDELGGVDQAARLYRGLPKSELAILPNADHAAVMSDHFWAIVVDFLQRHSGS